MLKRFWYWLFGKPEVKESYFVAVREGREMSRVEELPSGDKVFYVDVSDVPASRVEAFIQRAKKDLLKKKRNTEIELVIDRQISE